MRYHEIFEAAEPRFTGPTYDKYSDLTKAISTLHGATDLERVPVGPRHSRLGFMLGNNHLVDKSTGKVVGYWETTNADMIPGRGAVVTGHGQVAANDEPKKAAEPAAKSLPTGPATDEECKAALNELRLQMEPHGGRWAEWRPVEATQGGGYQFEVRDWGEWQNPVDAEDEEDYDWQELTDHSSKLLRSIIAKVRSAYPNVNLQELGSEKNWLVFSATSHQ